MQVDFQAICGGILDVVSSNMHEAPNVIAGSSTNLLNWAEATIDTKIKLDELVHRVTVTALREYQHVACRAYDVVFANDGQVRRFSSLLEQVKASNVPNRVQDALIAAKSAVGVMVTNAEQQLYNGSLPQEDLQLVFQQLKHSMGRCMVAHMVSSLKRSLTLPPDFQLVEDSVTAGDRRKLQQRIGSLNGAIVQLQEMASSSFGEHEAPGAKGLNRVSPLHLAEGCPTPPEGSHSLGLSADAGDTAYLAQHADDYADSPTAMALQRREADPLPTGPGHWQNGPMYTADSTGQTWSCTSRSVVKQMLGMRQVLVTSHDAWDLH